MAAEVDHLIVADNLSTDGTRGILHDLTGELSLTVVDDLDPAYYQSRKMTALAEQAASLGALWVVPFDADELWYAEGARIRDWLADAGDCDLVWAELTNHIRTALDPDDPDPFRSMVWHQPTPGPLGKVAVRWRPGAVIHQGNHGASIRGVDEPVFYRQPLKIRHFPVRSPSQFYSKGRNGAAAYAWTDLPETEGAHWRAYGALIERGGAEVMGDAFRSHWWHLSPADAGLIRDPAPYRRWENPR
jgi:hypothetical protein